MVCVYLCEGFAQLVAQVLLVLGQGVHVDDVGRLLHELEEVCQLAHNLLVHFMQPLVPVELAVDKHTDSIEILSPVIDRLLLRVDRKRRHADQIVMIHELRDQETVTELLPEQDELTVDCELGFGYVVLLLGHVDYLEPFLYVELG